MLHKLSPTTRYWVSRALIIAGVVLAALAGFYVPWLILQALY